MATETELALQRAIEISKGKAALARLVGVSAQTVQQWANGQRKVPPPRAYRIERALGIDRRWFRINDWREHWPDLIGSPIRNLVAEPAKEDA